MNMYRPVPRVPDFPAMEREILRFWEENRIFDKLRPDRQWPALVVPRRTHHRQ